jgi:PurA ssDNA and RNA-binding protein
VANIFLPFSPDASLTSAPSKMDSIIESRELQIERKFFSIDLRENGRGKFLRITEDSQGHRNVIIVPMSGVDDFADAIDDVLASEPAGQD